MRKLAIVCGVLVMTMIFGTKESVTGKPTEQRLVRIAELEIDADQLSAYTAALKEEISTSIRVEPGVLTLCAVAVKDHPTQIRIFETYADPDFRDVRRPSRVRVAFANPSFQEIQDRNGEHGEVARAPRNRPDSARH
jgi:quinol monooxygenase YgiN